MAIPSGCEATAASISWAMATMSNVSGAWYSTWTPMSSAAWFDAILDHRPVGVRSLTVRDHDEAEITPPSVILAERLGGEADGSEHYRDEQSDQL